MLSQRLSRRDVLATTAGLALASQISEPAKAQPARRIIVDAQVHIWNQGETLPPHRAVPYSISSGAATGCCSRSWMNCGRCSRS